MSFVHDHALLLLLHLLRAHLQRSHEADLLFPLGPDGHDLARFQRVFLVRQPPSRGRQAGRHQRRTGQDEADGASVNAESGKGVREGVEESEVGDQRAIVRLEEERVVVDCVEGGTVGAVFA